MKLATFGSIAYRFVARIFIVLLGLGAVAWGGFFLPLFWQQASLHQVASEYRQGQDFNERTLLEEAPQVAAIEQCSFCNPRALHDVVMLRVAILNDAIAEGNRTLIDSAYAPLYDATRRSLADAPANSFAWLTLYWLDASRRGFAPDNANYLRLSYALGPNEAWIALWRSRLAIAVFARLPADLANDAIDEFVKLVDTGGLYQETAAIFASAMPAAQSRIVAQLRTAQPIPREIFARTLYDKGLDVNIPGVVTPTRPWQ